MPLTVVHVFRDTDGTVPFMAWLDELEKRNPVAYGRCLQRIQLLEQHGSELRRPHADLLRDEIRELRFKVVRVNYRILYFFCGKNEACLSHGITKESTVPDREIDIAIRNKSLVSKNPGQHLAEWET